MDRQELWGLRLALLTELVRRSPNKLGRTAVMKMVYLLQTVKGVPLGYNFRLYTHGPFDEDVLNDLGQAVSMKGLKSTLLEYAGGYGYEFTKGPKIDDVKAFGESSLSNYDLQIDWAINEFSSKTASELELLSTIVYVVEDAKSCGRLIMEADLASQVRQIKPHFSMEQVRSSIGNLRSRGLVTTA